MDARLERLTAIAAGQHGVFSRCQARDLDIGRATLRSGVQHGRWTPVSTRVFRMAGVREEPRTRIMAAVLDCGTGAAASHTTAALLHRLPGFAPDPVHVTCTRRPRSQLGIVHHSTSLGLRQVAGVPVTSVARTLLDLGAIVHPDRVERAVDTALARKLVTYDELATVLRDLSASGRPGVRALRTALAGRSPTEAPPASELERRFRDLLRRHGLPQPERQVVLGSKDDIAGRVDCWFRGAGLVVELDGRAYHSATLDRLEDGRRDLVLLRSGQRVLRLTWQHVVERPLEVVTALEELLSCAA
jgi:very-short-patch-repair endonuclease